MLGSKFVSSKVSDAEETLLEDSSSYIEKLSFAEKTSPYLILHYSEPNILFFSITSFGVGIALLFIGVKLQSRIAFLSIPFLLLTSFSYEVRENYHSRICKNVKENLLM